MIVYSFSFVKKVLMALFYKYFLFGFKLEVPYLNTLAIIMRFMN